MNVHDQRLKFVLKANVIVRATQPTDVPKFVEGDSTNRTGTLVQSSQFLRSLANFYLSLCQSRQHGLIFLHVTLREVLACTLLTEVEFFRFVVDNFRDMESRRFLTALTFHRVLPLNQSVFAIASSALRRACRS